MTAFHIARELADVASQLRNCAEGELKEKGGLSSVYGLQLVGRKMNIHLNTPLSKQAL